jgi:hypothetical protein
MFRFTIRELVLLTLVQVLSFKPAQADAFLTIG